MEWASRFMTLHQDLWPGLGGRGRGAEGVRSGGLRPAQPRVSDRPRRRDPRAPGPRRRHVGMMGVDRSDGRVDGEAAGAVEAVWRIESARLIAGLARVTGDVGLAEELAQDALVIGAGAVAAQPASRPTRAAG